MKAFLFSFFIFGILGLLEVASVRSALAADDSQVFPNQVQTGPPRDQSKPQVVAVPQAAQTPDAGTLSPANMSQMGMGVQIPLGGGAKNSPAAQSNDDDTKSSDDSK